MTLPSIAEQITETGSVVVHDVLSPADVAEAKSALMTAIEKEGEYHRTRGSGHQHRDYAMVLVCSLYGRIFIDLLANPRFIEPFNGVLGPGCIVYAYTSSSMPPRGGNYSTRVHVDSPRIIPGYITNMGSTILLDDFTADNGATYYLPGSQLRADAPSAEELLSNGKRVIAPAGSVWFFNARVWHAGGENKTDKWRHALTVNMCRPFMKQRIDIPRVMSGMDLTGVPEVALQKLGFRAQVPASYDEYYAPPEKRTYTQAVE